jgi:hypothetical protein
MEVARAYCAAIEAHAEAQPRELFEQLELLLAQLIAGVLRLPGVHRPGPAPPKRDFLTTWQPVIESLADWLGEHRHYWAVFDPTTPPKDEPTMGDLADDLTDIYCDLRRGLDAWDAADATTRLEIVWTWRFGYESHWGHHAVDALRTIYEHLTMLKLGRSTGATETQEAGA